MKRHVLFNRRQPWAQRAPHWAMIAKQAETQVSELASVHLLVYHLRINQGEAKVEHGLTQS